MTILQYLMLSYRKRWPSGIERTEVRGPGLQVSLGDLNSLTVILHKPWCLTSCFLKVTVAVFFNTSSILASHKFLNIGASLFFSS
ncbi:hypothetical protein Peur_047115 [Populus x canadensis]